MKLLRDLLSWAFAARSEAQPTASTSVQVNLDLARELAEPAESYPLSSQVALLRKRSGTWCLTDWRRFSREHDSFQAALDDRTQFRRLHLGEPLA